MEVVVRLLFVGDVHLGRRPARLPVDMADYGIRESELTPAAAWRTCVDFALRESVDALVFAGDVVDGVEDRFEAYGHLKSGVERLVAGGIEVFGVAGNHDVEALPRLAEQIPQFRLVGAGGRWETALVAGEGAGVRLVGWSFPTLRVSQDPLETFDLARDDALATLGVLHCDVDAGRSVYAPVRRSRLAEVPVDAWFLGHIHKPSALSDPFPIGYLGCLVGMAPRDDGVRGPWLVTVEGPGLVRAEQVPLAPLRWESIEVAASRVDALLEGRGDLDVESIEDAVFAVTKDALAAVRERLEDAVPRAVGSRIIWTGETRFGAAIASNAEDPSRWPHETWDGAHFFVSKMRDDSAPALDLEQLSRGNDPLALLARRVLLLERGGEAARPLIEAGARALGEAQSAPRWRGTQAELEDEERVRALLLRAGRRSLATLAEQRTNGAHAGIDA